jgi:hypothetical protein
MADTTFEQAQRCTFCLQPSSLVNVRPLPQGGKVHTFECKNERCSDNGGRRIIQTNPDGSLAQREQGPKTFAKLNHFSENARRAREELQILELQSLHPNWTRADIIRYLGG